MALTGSSIQKAHMDKKDLLALMRLLSALESWSFSTGQRLPDYLLDDLNKFTLLLETEILKERNDSVGAT